MPYLVNNQQAIDTLTSLQLDAGRRAGFADPARHPSIATSLETLHAPRARLLIRP